MNEAVASDMADPRDVIAHAPMGIAQKLVIALCVSMLAIDGYDILSIGFAAPAISAAWGIDKSTLGLVLSMELFGMGIGSVLFGRAADLFGRRPTTIVCLVIIAGGMAMASTAQTVMSLSSYRLITGLGIGGVLACASAISAEVSNIRAKAMAVTLMASGVPIGGLLGGPMALHFVASGQWSAVFLFGAVITAALIPLCWVLLPETPAYLMRARRSNEERLTRINLVLSRFGHGQLASLPPVADQPPRGLIRAIVVGGYARITILLILAYFLHVITLYFAMKWIPKIVVDLGHSAPEGIAVLLWLNGGGLCGCLLISLASLKLDNRVLVSCALLLTSLVVALFGQVPTDLGWLKAASALVGFFSNAAIVGFYAVMAESFPSHLRGSGSGLVLGFGRAGAALGPVAAGLLFASNFGLGAVTFLMAFGSFFGGATLFSLRRSRREIY